MKRIGITQIILACGLAACAGPSKNDATVQAGANTTGDEHLPTLFQADTTYELVTPDGKRVRGYAFAVDDKAPGQQTIRWFLLDGFVSPVQEDIAVRRMADSSDGGAPPASAEAFAAFARKSFESGKTIYVKSHADTFRSMYTAPGNDKPHSIVPVPVPMGRRRPDPPGDSLPVSSAAKFQQIDGGGVGIRPSPPVEIGYFDPASLMTKGVIGFAFAGPELRSNTEMWFLSKDLFPSGLEGTTVGPYRYMAAQVMGEKLSDWAVVVVASSYYRHAVPNQW